MRTRILIGAGIGLMVILGVALIMSLRPTSEEIDAGIGGTPTTTATTPDTPTAPSDPGLPDGEGRIVAGDLSVLVPKGYRGKATITGSLNQVTLLDRTGADRLSVLWAPTGATSLSQLAAPLTERPAGDRSAPKVTAGELSVAGMKGRVVRLDYPLYRRTRVIAVALGGARGLTIQAVVPQAQGASADKLVRTLARTTVVRAPGG